MSSAKRVVLMALYGVGLGCGSGSKPASPPDATVSGSVDGPGSPAPDTGTTGAKDGPGSPAPDTGGTAGKDGPGTVSPDTTVVPAGDAARVDTGAGDAVAATGRGFPAVSPFLVYYDTAESMGDLSAVANQFRIIDLDVDPGLGNFTKAQVTTLKGGGKNRVLGYLNLGACENFRVYWATVPSGFVSCSANKAAQLGTYDGWENETWMNLGNADHQKLVLEHIAPGIAGLGVDGFYFDNLDIVDHGTNTTNGPCNAACVSGALDTVRKLREKYPDFLFVMQNAVGVNTFEGKTGGVAFTTLLDGIVGENTFTSPPNDNPGLVADTSLLSDLLRWKGLGLKPGGRSFFIGTLEYVKSCSNTADLTKVVTLGTNNGFTTYVSLESLSTICPYWMK